MVTHRVQRRGIKAVEEFKSPCPYKIDSSTRAQELPLAEKGESWALVDELAPNGHDDYKFLG